MKRSIGLLWILILFILSACASVPKESVELSATVGRDIAQMYKMHRELAVILYGRIKNDINKFIDEVYAPYQIKKQLQADYKDFEDGDPNSLFSALNTAIKQPNNPEVQKTALDSMDVLLQVVQADIESYRRARLEPVLAQEEKVLSAIDRSYNQIHYANSIVTGHLASVVRVYDAQEELLKEFGIEGLRKEIMEELTTTSNNVAKFVDDAKLVKGTIEEIEKMTEELDNLVKSSQSKEEG